MWSRRDIHTEITYVAITVWIMNWPDSSSIWEAFPKSLYCHWFNIMSWEKKMQNKQNKTKNNKQQQQKPLCLHFQPVAVLNVKGNKSRATRYAPKIYIWLVISASLTLYLVEHVNMEKKKLAQNVTLLEPKEIRHYNHTYRNCVVQAAIFTWSCKNFWNLVFLSDHESTWYFCRASDICAHSESKHMQPCMCLKNSLQPFIATSLWACWIVILCICVSIRGWWGEAVWKSVRMGLPNK